MADHDTHDHTGVPGVGTSGGIAATIMAAKGDILGASANDTPAVTTVGANDTILMADSSQTTGLKWVASQTPSTQAFSDAAAEGTADTYARGDHKHGMMASPGGGGLSSGTSFPGSPTDNDLFYRTDLECGLYRYESTGTKWLCSVLHEVPWTTRTAVGSGLTVTTTSWLNGPTLGDAGDMWLVDFSADIFVLTTNNGSDYWQMALQKLDAANSATLVTTLSTVSNTPSNWIKEKNDIDAALTGSAHVIFRVDLTRVNSGGSIIAAPLLTYHHLFDV